MPTCSSTAEGYCVHVYERFRHALGPDLFRRALSDPDTVYLVDPGSADSSPEPLQTSARTILVSSPDQRHYKQWHSGAGAETFYMPAWEDAELRAVRRYVCPQLSDDDFEDRLYDFGGVVRPLIATASELQTRWGANQQRALKAEVVLQVATLGLMDIRRGDDPPPTSLFKFVPQDDFQYYSIAPISAYAAAAIAFDKWTKIEEMAAAREGSEGGVWGKIWEGAMKVAVASGGTFVVRKAGDRVSATSKLKLPSRPLTMIPGGWSSFEKAVASADGSAILTPGNTTQPAIDFADGRLRGFQATLAEKHPVSDKVVTLLDECKVKKTSAMGSERFRLYFVVPTGRFDSFAKQKCPDPRIEQWVMRLEKEALAKVVPRSYETERRDDAFTKAQPKKKARTES